MDVVQCEQPRAMNTTHDYQTQTAALVQQQQPPSVSADYYHDNQSRSKQEVMYDQSTYLNEQPPPVPPKMPGRSISSQSVRYQQTELIHQELPALPPRHQDHTYNGPTAANFGSHEVVRSAHEQPPPIPQRSQSRNNLAVPVNEAPTATGYIPPPPPIRYDSDNLTNDNTSDPAHYTRDPRKLVAYLIPFPKPHLEGVDPSTIPTRFLIYTPPPPPLTAPKEGEKEGKLHKVQRKWQSEVRSAKTSTAKAASWKGVKSRATKAIAWGVNQTTTSNIEFLGRVNNDQTHEHSDSSTSTANSTSRASSPSSLSSSSSSSNTHTSQNDTNNSINSLHFIHPPLSLSETDLRTEFIHTMLRTKSRAQRDSIIATGLLPVSFGIDVLATLVWPFGGLAEIDSVWLYSSVRGAKTARDVTKRLGPASPSSSLSSDTDRVGKKEEQSLELRFTPSDRVTVLRRYLDAECHRVDKRLFPVYVPAPTEGEVLRAMGWNVNVKDASWEDEQWEMSVAKEDVKSNMHKGAKEWRGFCTAFEKDPEKALRKK